jgi:hypothetical protein
MAHAAARATKPAIKTALRVESERRIGNLRKRCQVSGATKNKGENGKGKGESAKVKGKV